MQTDTQSPAPRSLEGNYPHFTMAILPYDDVTKDVCLLYRGKNVRSAPERWSIPTGLLEHGESFEDCAKRELFEELGIPWSSLGRLKFHTLHRNIPGDGYDWVIGVWSVPVGNLMSVAENREPDKHDEIEVLHFRNVLGELTNPKFVMDDPMRQSLNLVLNALFPR